MSSETFEQVLTAAQADGSFTPAWKKFVKTKFFVPVIGADKESGGLLLRMSDLTGDGKQSILISELRERVEEQQGGSVARLYGGDVVHMLQAEASILVALSDRAFNIAKDRVEWLKKGLEASQARVAAQAAGCVAPALAPRPHPPTVAASAPAAAPASASARRSRGVLDVASLKPRNVALPKIGLEFFVPSAWRQSETAKGLRFVDDDTAAVIEASGFHRPNVGLTQWLGMRLDLVRHEMRYLQQDGESTRLDGQDWRGRVKGMATEFTGTFPGEAHESRYLVACICIDGTLASITVKACADVFEGDRELYKWLLSRVDIAETAASVYGAPAAGAADIDQDGPVPGVFGMSSAGRMGRARTLAYSFPIMLPALGVGIAALLMGPQSSVAIGVMVAMAAVVTLWFSLRLLVLRLHDVNLSGKWILGFLALVMVAGAMQKPLLISIASVVFWLASLVIYFILPGTAGENDYGPQPGPNSALVKSGAILFVLLQLAGLVLVIKAPHLHREREPLEVADASTPERDPNALTWRAPDGSMMIDFPAAPTTVELPQVVRDNLGGVRMEQYRAVLRGRTFMVQMIDYGKTPASSLGSLEGIGMSVVGRDGVQVSENRSLRFNGHEGREVRASAPGGMMRSARFVIVGPRVYMAMAVTHDDAASVKSVDLFLRSFSLLP